MRYCHRDGGMVPAVRGLAGALPKGVIRERAIKLQ
jgi:hypothetical protein